MKEELELLKLVTTRRELFRKGASGIGGYGTPFYVGSPIPCREGGEGGVAFRAQAKRVIFLFMNGAPSQQDLFDYKPMVEKYHGQELFKTFDADSGEWSDEGFVEKTQRLTGMTSGQKSFPIARSKWKFKQHGESRAWVSELLPHTAEVADDLCFIKSMHTEAINHDPGVTFFKPVTNNRGVQAWAHG